MNSVNSVEIMHLDHAQIPIYVESQAAMGRNRASVLKEIATLRKDVILLSVAEDESTFQQKINAAIKSSLE